MKVTDIEVHEIALEYQDALAYEFSHYYHISGRTVYVVHTDNGLVGLGEGHQTEPQDVLDQYIGSNPFDWIGDETSLALGTAMYDLMGKAAGVPVYKLFGQRYRAWVPVASWTVSTHPDRMAAAVEHYAARGYTWLKFHLSPWENVIEQTEAMQAVAPEGFKIHYDFTMQGTDDHMVDLLDKLAEFPIAGCFEDVLPSADIPGHIALRQRAKLPVVLHHGPLGHTYEVLMGAADAYMLGHSKIGDAVRRAGLFAAGNLPFMMQNVGGNITRAMTTHMMAAFPSATFHTISCTETWPGDVVHEQLEPVNGLVRVPEAPGLGLTLDREALERLESLPRREHQRWIIKSQFKNGTKLYGLVDPRNRMFLVRPDVSRLLPMRYAEPIVTEYWDDDGTSEYAAMLGRLEDEGVVLEG
ncbi:MAG: hypothetical protein CL878_10740 [Dehalococcoidia bacterium]|nr:hypothetical protein [Dehalococcoidia bacterium]